MKSNKFKAFLPENLFITDEVYHFTSFIQKAPSHKDCEKGLN
jgi:hypothetical protein